MSDDALCLGIRILKEDIPDKEKVSKLLSKYFYLFIDKAPAEDKDIFIAISDNKLTLK